jgi:membrane protease YdiL (CAAX protease family)
MREKCRTISSMAESAASIAGRGDAVGARSRRRALVEIALAYGLILLVLWTPRPWQRLLWFVAAGAVAAMTCFSLDGAKAMGLRGENFFRSLWVAGAALAVGGGFVTVAGSLHTLRLPGSPLLFVETYWGYAVWTFVQQFLLQCFFLARLRRLLPGPRWAALAAAGLFALAHLPNPILASGTFLWGLAACLLFLRYRNLYPLAMAHALLGIAVAAAVPGPVIHNMRVGLGYLTYTNHSHSAPHASAQP